MKPIKVTVAIPTYNRSAYLRQSMDCALNQTVLDLEVLVTDNQSTDDTADVVASYQDSRVRYIRNEKNLGMFGNWNRALELAQGEYFLLLSDDDLIAPDYLARMLRLFEVHPNLAFAYGKNVFIDSQGRQVHQGHTAPQTESGWEITLGFLRSERTINPCSELFRTADIRALGGYPGDRYRLAGDAWLWMTLALQKGKVGFDAEAVAYYRTHAASETSLARLDMWLEDHQQLFQDLKQWVPSQVAELGRAFHQHDAIMLMELLNKSHQQGHPGSLARAWQYRQILLKHPSALVLRKWIQLLLPVPLVQQFKSLLRGSR